jgi:hypothetical protein
MMIIYDVIYHAMCNFLASNFAKAVRDNDHYPVLCNLTYLDQVNEGTNHVRDIEIHWYLLLERNRDEGKKQIC